jgi:hypothetical protein
MAIPYSWRNGTYTSIGDEMVYVYTGTTNYFDPSNMEGLLTLFWVPAYGSVVMAYQALMHGADPKSIVRSTALAVISALLALASVMPLIFERENITVICYFVAGLLTVCAVCRICMSIRLLRRKRAYEP